MVKKTKTVKVVFPLVGKSKKIIKTFKAPERTRSLGIIKQRSKFTTVGFIEDGKLISKTFKTPKRAGLARLKVGKRTIDVAR